MANSISENDNITSLKAQIREMADRKPFLREILDAFEGIMIAGLEFRAELAALPTPKIVPPDPTQLSADFPLLSYVEFQEMVPHLKAGVQKMLTALGAAFPPLKEDINQLRSQVDGNSNPTATWLGILIRNEENALIESAEELGLEPDVFRFALEQMFKPLMQWLAQSLARYVEQMVWDRGYCPICGSYPDASYLKKGKDEQEYLIAHGGQRWLHCSMCGYEWRLHRIVCPYCGNDDADSLEYFAAKKSAHEKLYVCHKCKRYLACMDTSALIRIPSGDLLPFELLHLDIMAREKGFIPLKTASINKATQ